MKLIINLDSNSSDSCAQDNTTLYNSLNDIKERIEQAGFVINSIKIKWDK